MKKLRGLYVLGTEFFDLVYSERERGDIARLVEITAPPQSASALREHPEWLRDCEVIFSGWGGPRLDEDFLRDAPQLKLVLYAAGSARDLVSQAMWDRGIRFCSAYAANAVPVVEYTLGTILFSLKQGWRYAREIRESRHYPAKWPVPGAYGSTIGLVSMGMIARLLGERLRTFDLKIIAYDPFFSPVEAEKMGVRLVTLEELFAQSDVISLHTPELPETDGLITGSLISSMKPGATLINTARGSVIRERELVEVLAKRPDLQAILDVTDPEPPVADSPLYTLPNVLLTPHIAGSMDGECRRMGRAMVEELERFVAGEPLRWEITPELARTTSHRPAFMNKPGSA